MGAIPTSGPAVSLQDAVALAGRYPLLAGCDLEVAHGETALIEGANGAGKTSLLRVPAFSRRPWVGSASWGSIRSASAHACDAGSASWPTPPTSTTT